MLLSFRIEYVIGKLENTIIAQYETGLKKVQEELVEAQTCQDKRSFFVKLFHLRENRVNRRKLSIVEYKKRILNYENLRTILMHNSVGSMIQLTVNEAQELQLLS